MKTATRATRANKNAQPAQLRIKTRKFPRKRRTKTGRKPAGRSFRFSEAKGKTVDYVEFYTVHGYHCVDMAFADKTALHFTIDPAFNVEPGYSSWKTGNQRILRSWAPIHCS